MQYFMDVLTLTSIPTTTWDTLDLVGFDDAKVTADDAPVKGVAKHPCAVIGDPTAVMALGVARVRARGAITKGAKLISAAAGGVKVAGAGAVNVFSTALTAAADGEFVDILVR